MKSSRMFWGTLFVATGVLLLLAKLELVHFELGSAWKFWPLVLVLWGIGVLTGVRGLKIAAVTTGALLLAIAIFELSQWWFFDREGEGPTTQKIVEGFDKSVRRASFAFESGAGSFRLMDTCADLFHADASSEIGRYRFDSRMDGDMRAMNMKLVKGGGLWGSHLGDHWVDIALHPAPVWDLSFETGAAGLKLDLTPFIVERLHIKTGAGEVRVALGDRAPSTDVTIDADVSSVKIRVPESAGCEITSHATLSSRSFPGFKEVTKGVYRTSNFSSAPGHITMALNADVSSVRIERYEKDQAISRMRP